jgi:hypothetical protein
MTEEKKETGKTESAPAPVVVQPVAADLSDLEGRVQRLENAMETIVPRLLAVEKFVKETEAAAKALMGGKLLPKFLGRG